MNSNLPPVASAIDEALYSLRYVYPELALTGAFLIVILVGLFAGKRFPKLTFYLTLIAIGCTALLECCQFADHAIVPVFSGMILPGRASIFFRLIFCLIAFLFAVFANSNKELQEHKKGTADLYSILLAVLLGMNLMAMSVNLLMIYVSIEMVSIGSYLMVGYISGRAQQTEAAMKYAIFGAICSAVMLYGMSVLYALTGTLDIAISINTHDGVIWGSVFGNAPVSLAGVSALTMILVGIGFKVSVVPAHFWSPDVYEGAPTPVTAFLSTGPKIAGFALLFGPAATVLISASQALLNGVALAAIATMVVGNFAAIWQNSVKRMLAYSAIGNSGFVLMAAGRAPAMEPVLFYLLIYSIMTMAAFMLVSHIEEQTGAITVNDYKGLGKKMPLVFFTLTIVLISLVGIPLTAGFISKFLIFSAVFNEYTASGSVIKLALLITGALTTVVSLFYYFKIPLNAYLRNSEKETAPESKNTGIVYLSFVLMILLILFGLFPQLLTNCLNI